MAKWPAARAPTHGVASSGEDARRRRENDFPSMLRGIASLPGLTTLSDATTASVVSLTGSSSEDDEEDTSLRMPVPVAAMSIPRFRSCRPSSSSYDEISLRSVSKPHRRRTVSMNSLASTSSYSSICSFDNASTMTPSLDEDEGVSTLSAPRLPPSPYPVDPYHFYTRQQASTATLVQEIRQLLAECDIEYSFKAYKCKFKCVKYVQYSHVEFILRLYSSPTSDGVLLLEFQRRSGSLLLWDGLYSMMYHRLTDWVDFSAPPCPQSGTQKKVAPREENSISVKVWKKLSASAHTPTSGVEAMKIMVTSPYADAQREGCSALAMITEESENAFLVAKCGIVECLVDAASSDDLLMARSAIGALGNISKALVSFPDQNLAARTLEHIKHTARIVVKRLGHTSESLFSLELRRECARVLSFFGRICPNEVVACEGQALLQHHLNHRDHLLSALCREALRELQGRM